NLGSKAMPGDRQTPTVRLRRRAAELRYLCAPSGLTRDEIAERTGINVATLYRIERIEHARVKPQTRTLRTLLDLYGVEQAQRGELIGLPGDGPPEPRQAAIQPRPRGLDA